MKERLSKLLTVKSIVALRGTIPQEVMTICTTVIGFCFGTQTAKTEIIRE